MKQVPSLSVKFTWDQTAGNFQVTLPNGARFRVERHHVSGKLENSLTLYRNGVVRLLEEGRASSKELKDGTLVYEYDESKVVKYSRNGHAELTLEDLDL